MQTPAETVLRPIEWMTLVALVVGPLMAVGTQLYFSRRRESRNQKIWVFGTLMSLRAAIQTPDCVRALNYIDVVFYKNQKIRDRWKELLGYLAGPDWKPDVVVQQTLDRTKDLYAQLVAEIAEELGYEYDHTHIKENAYYPRGQGLLEEETAKLRKLQIAVLEGKSLNVTVLEPGVPAPALIGAPRRP